MLFPKAPLTEQQEKLVIHLAEFHADDVENAKNILAEIKQRNRQIFKIRLETNLKKKHSY